MRLQAKFLGLPGPGVDLGSNDDEFWVWLQTGGTGQAPMMMYANHVEFAQTLSKQKTPIRPDWLIDAMGLVALQPQSEFEGPIVRTDKNWEIRVRTLTPAGSSPESWWWIANMPGCSNSNGTTNSIEYWRLPEPATFFITRDLT